MTTYHEGKKINNELFKDIVDENNVAERWYCRKLKKEMSSQLDAIPIFNRETKKWKWLCDCTKDIEIDEKGNKYGACIWTSGQDRDHELIESKPKHWFIYIRNY